MARKTKNTLYCSFCGKSQDEIRKLIAGPTVFICNECVDVCMDVIVEDTLSPDEIKVRIFCHGDANDEIEQTLLNAMIRGIKRTNRSVQISLASLRQIGEKYEAILSIKGPSVAEKKTAIKEEVWKLAAELDLAKNQLLEERSARSKIENKLRELQDIALPLLIEQHRKNNPGEGEIKTLAVMFLDIKGFSGFSAERREAALTIIRGLAAPLLQSGGGMYVNTWGDAIVAGFSAFHEGVACAVKFLLHLGVEGVEARIGMAVGPVRVVHNKLLEKEDIDGDTVNLAARLEPLAESGEVLITKELRYMEEVSKLDFGFTEVKRKFRKDVGSNKVGDELICYAVARRANHSGGLF